MTEQIEQKITIPQEHSHKKHYAAIIVSSGAALVLLMIVVILLYKHPARSSMQSVSPVPQLSKSQQQAASLQNQVQKVTPVPITSKKDLDTALQNLNTTDTTQIDTGLNQNAQDTVGFSQ